MKPMTEKAALGSYSRGPGTLLVNEIFYSIQGEGARVGTPMVFVRLARCNLRCAANNSAGFDCDTDFQGARRMTFAQIEQEAAALLEPNMPLGDAIAAPKDSAWILWTGGEPGLQLGGAALTFFGERGWLQAIETNGTIKLEAAHLLDHITVSPKTAEHTIRQRTCHELRVVRKLGQELPELKAIDAAERFVSPAFLPGDIMDPDALAWCVGLVKNNPGWRLSLQTHKLIGAR